MNCKSCIIPCIVACPIQFHAFDNELPTDKCSFKRLAKDIHAAGKAVGYTEGSQDLGSAIMEIFNAGRSVGNFGPRRG